MVPEHIACLADFLESEVEMSREEAVAMAYRLETHLATHTYEVRAK